MARPFRHCLLAIVALLSAALGPGSAAFAADTEGGMLAWPREEMARALSIYLPRRMAEEDVPGLAIAVVADGRIMFEQGYGTSDIAGLSPVTANTLFEAASLGKPVAAVGALALVEEGRLSLDAPLGTSLETRWLGNEEDHRTITLRQVLTHTSGLSNYVRCCSDETWSEPGEDFSYSGVGYMYLGHVMAQVTEMPFDKFMRARVFGPLDMVSSGYGLAEPLVPTVARGFAPLWYALLVFFVPLLVFAFLASGASVLLIRFGFNRLKLEGTDFVPAAIISLMCTLGLLGVILGGWGLLATVFYVAASGLLFLLATLLVLVVFAFLGLLGPGDGTLAEGRQRTDPTMTLVAITLVFVIGLFFVGRNVPVPAMAGDTVNPAFSLRASAHDLGLFVEGFVGGRIVGPEMRDRMLAETVDIGGGIGWGLGFGVRDGAMGRTGWQWGANAGFEALMVVDPKRRAGLVILSNSSKAGPLLQEVAGHVMGEVPGWHMP